MIYIYMIYIYIYYTVHNISYANHINHIIIYHIWYHHNCISFITFSKIGLPRRGSKARASMSDRRGDDGDSLVKNYPLYIILYPI